MGKNEVKLEGICEYVLKTVIYIYYSFDTREYLESVGIECFSYGATVRLSSIHNKDVL